MEKLIYKESPPKESIGEHIDNFMSVNEKELLWLYEVAGNMKSIVEIGSCKGRSTYALCSSECPLVISIDDFGVFPDTYPDFLNNTKNFKNLRQLRMLSEQAKSFVIDVDMVFIDGMHDYNSVTTDLRSWFPKTKKLICGHDYNDQSWTDVKKAVNDYFQDLFKVEVFETIWAVSKI
jgi:Methyltransferase domain